MNKEFLVAGSFLIFPTCLVYYLSNLVIDKVNSNNINFNRLILLEEKFSQLEKRTEKLEEFKNNYYQNSFIGNNWNRELIESSDEED